MFLHVGNGETEKISDIIGLFDMDSATVSSITRGFLRHAEQDKRVTYGDSDLPRTFILVGKAGEKRRPDTCRVRLSHISTQGLGNRLAEPLTSDEEE